MRDLRGRSRRPWMRRGLVALLAIPVVLALTGALGQQTKTLRTVAADATLQVEVPDVLRGGLMWRARIVVRATRTIEHPRIVLGSGFVHGMQLNTLEPAPESEAAAARGSCSATASWRRVTSSSSTCSCRSIRRPSATRT